MLKISIETEKIEISQNLTCQEQLADELMIVLDRIIIDEYIKASPVQMKLPDEEKKRIIKEKRMEVLNRMRKRPIDMSYAYSSLSSIKPLPCEKCKLMSCLECKEKKNNV